VLGFKVPVFIKNRSTSAEAAISTDVEYVSKQVLFYPDSDNLCWGYVVDIPENRKVLVNSLSAGWYKIVDKATEKEISDMAVAKGKSIKPIEKEVMRVKGDKEKTLTDALNKKDQELEELKAKLEKLESDRKPIADALGIKK
jgi:chaperone required for assembly of F1-ATPase